MYKTQQNKKLNRLLIFFSVLISIIIIDACRKIDLNRNGKSAIDYASKFFNVPAHANPTVKRLVALMQEYNKNHEFVSKLAKKHGIPVWNKCPTIWAPSTHRGNGGGGPVDTLAMIPLILDTSTKRVSSFLCAVARQDSIKIRLFNADEYARYNRTNRMDTLSSETIAGMSMYMEGLVTDGRDSFRLTDNGLFHDTHYTNESDSLRIVGVNVAQGHERGNRTNRSATIIYGSEEICNTFSVHNIHHLLGFRGQTLDPEPDYTYEICTTVETWSYVIDNEPGMILGQGGGGAGNLDQTVNCSNFPGPGCGGPPHWGWQPLVENEPGGNGFDPYQADSIRIDPNSHLQDSFPCLVQLIDTILNPNPNVIAQVALHDIFGVSVYNHLTYTIDWNMDSTSEDGMTNPGRREWVGDFMHFYDTIRLNPYIIKHGSKEKIIELIIHEALHAYINWCILSYNNSNANGIDSIYLKSHFGIYWEYIIGRQYIADAPHNAMVHNFSSFMVNLIRTYGNPNAPFALKTFVAQALTYASMKKTSYWNTLTDTCRYKGVNLCAAMFSYGSNNPVYVPGCGTYGFLDSLQMIRADSCQ